MRKPSPAILVASVVIALAGSTAFAQSMSGASRPNASTAASPTASSPRASTGGSTTTTNTSSTTRPSTARTGSGNTNINANSPTGNGSTSTTGTATLGNPTVLTNADGSKTSATLNADGSRTIVTMNMDGSTTTQNLPANLFNPSVVNGTIGGVTADGERILDEREQVNRSAAALEAQGNTATAEVLRSSVSIDRVIRSAEKDRRKIGKNGQLLNSIAPRTNVDRTDQMRDDGPTPALSGLANSLSQR